MYDLVTEISKLLHVFQWNDDVAPLRQALQTLDHAEPDAGIPTEGALAFQASKLQLLLSVFNSIDAKLIAGIDPDMPPPMMPPPPDETGLPSGVSPASIKDPRLRARYEADIAANQVKLKQFSFQLSLRDVDESALELFESHLSEHTPKSAAKAVAELLDASMKSKTRAQTLKAIAVKVLGEAS